MKTLLAKLWTSEAAAAGLVATLVLLLIDLLNNAWHLTGNQFGQDLVPLLAALGVGGAAGVITGSAGTLLKETRISGSTGEDSSDDAHLLGAIADVPKPPPGPPLGSSAVPAPAPLFTPASAPSHVITFPAAPGGNTTAADWTPPPATATPPGAVNVTAPAVPTVAPPPGAPAQ